MKTLIKFLTISLLITTNFIISLPNARSQNIIPNGGFENLNKISCGSGDESTNFCSSDQNSCSQRTVDPFKNGGIQNWSSAVGSPQLNTPNCPNRTDAIGNHAAFLTSNATGILNIEGIFQEGINFKPDEYYTISLKYKSINNAKIVVKLTTGLTNVTTNGSALPTPTTSQLVIEDDSNIPSSWTTLTIPNFQPNDIYNQFLIYADPNGTNISTAKIILVDEVSILKSCCLSNKTYDNLFNPPSIYVQDYIRCNSNVTFTNNSDTYLAAKNEILLANNITIVDVNSFVAQAEDCLAKQVEFYAYLVRVNCTFEINLSACYGSGKYKFYFDEEESDSKIKSYELSDKERTVNVKVLDVITGTILTKTIIIPPSPPFYGKPRFVAGNVFTPNGDGKNDIWKFTDGGKTTLAYNAYRFKLQIFTNWGTHVKIIEKELNPNNLNGFNDQELFWDGRDENGKCTDGDYFYILEFSNCSGDHSYRGAVKVIGCPKNLIETLNTNEQTNESNFPTEIYPNPTVDNLSLKLYNVTKNSLITITDILGKQLNIDCKLVENKNGIQEYNIDCSLLNNGIYFCIINKNGITETIKFSVIK